MQATTNVFEHLLTPYSNFPALALQPGHPAYYDAQQQICHVFRYAEVQRVYSDFRTFSSDRNRILPTEQPFDDPAQSSMISIDPPRHKRIRALVAQAFTPHTVARLEPRIRAIAQDLLDQVIDQGKMDIIDDFAFHLPVLVIAELLGVPSEDREQFRFWTAEYLSMDASRTQQASKAMAHYFQSQLASRRQQRGEDLLSLLLSAQVDGQRLTHDELIGNSMSLLIAGNETTRHLIANAILCLDAYPESMKQVTTDPTRIPNALEEVLRYLPPVLSSTRIVTVETQIDDQRVQAGQWVHAWIMAANRDAAHFPDPHRFDIQRRPNPHLSFGNGIHFCLGAHLARVEGKVALEELLARIGNITCVYDPPLERTDHPLFCSVKHLPITFQPR